MRNGEDLEVRKGIVRKNRGLRMLFAYTMAAVLTFAAVPTTLLYAEPVDPTIGGDPAGDPSGDPAGDPTGDPENTGGGEPSGNPGSVASHIHSWVYASSGNVIDAWCEGEGDCTYKGTTDSHESAQSLQITAVSCVSYDGAPHGATLERTPDDAEDNPFGSPAIQYTGTTAGAVSYDSAEAPTDAGSYTASVTVEGKTASTSFAIQPVDADITYPVAITGLVYDGTEQALVTAGSVSGGTIKYTLNGEVSDTPPTAANAGSYSVSYKITVDGNHNGGEGVISAAIAKRPVTVSGIEVQDKEYDSLSTATLIYDNVLMSGKLEGDALSVTTTGTFTDVNAGNGKAVSVGDITLSGSEETLQNYELAATGQQTVATANISQKPLTVSWSHTDDLVYNGTEQAPAAEISGVCTGDSCFVSVSGGRTAAGENYTATASLSNSNYRIEGTSGRTAFAITPKSLSNNMMTLDADRFAFRGSEITPVLTVSDGRTALIEGADYELVNESENSGTECRDYTIRISGKGNYRDCADKVWTIFDNTAPTATITVQDYESPFTTFINAITFNIFYKEKKLVTIEATDMESGIKENGLSYYLSETAMTEQQLSEAAFTTYTVPFEIEAERNYVIYAKVEDNAGHIVYISSNGIVMDVTPPDIVLSSEASNEENDYFGPVSYQITDQDLKEVTVTSVGETTGADTTNLEVTNGAASGANSEVGSYLIAATDKAGNRTTKNFQIKRADGTVTPEDKEYTYVTGVPYDVSGLFTIAEGTGEADTYEVVSGGTGYGTLSGSNLTISKAGTIRIRMVTKQLDYVKAMTAEATLTVLKGTGSASITATSEVYGTLPTIEPSTTTNEGLYTLSYREKKEGAVEVSELPKGVGKYTVKVTYPENLLYTEATAEADFEITKAPLTVSAENKTKKYGETDPELTYSVSGLKWNDTAGGVLEGKLTRTEGEDTGTYEIKKGTLNANGNYELTFIEAEFTIEKAPHTDIALPSVKEIPSTGVEDRRIDLSEYLEKEPVLESSAVYGDIRDAVTVNGLAGTELSYSMTNKYSGATGEIRLTVSSKNYEDYTISIPIESKKRIPNVELNGSSDVANGVSANGLREYTNSQPGSSVEVNLTVTPEQEPMVEAKEPETVERAKEISADVFSGIDSAKVKRDYLDVSVTKNTTYANGTVKTGEKVSDVARVLELEFDCSISNRNAPVVLRNHGGKIIQLKKLSERPQNTRFSDGTFYISNNKLFVYSRFYSTFAVIYSMEPAYAVSLELGGGKQSLKVIGEGQVMPQPEDPILSGATFLGWYDAAGNLFDFGSSINEDTVIKALWRYPSGGAVDPGEPGVPAAEGTALSGVIASVYQRDNAVRAAKLNASIKGGKTIAARAPKTGDTLPPLWLLAILFASGGTMIVIYILSAYARLRKSSCEDASSR